LGKAPSREAVKGYLVEGFELEVGATIRRGSLTLGEEKILSYLIAERKKEDWIYSKDNELRHLVSDDGRGTRVKEGVTVLESIYKAGKLVRVTVVLVEGNISGISISGDFFTQPFIGAVEKLEAALIGVELEDAPLRTAVSGFFGDSGVRMMGVTPDDLVVAILKAKEYLH
jgi:hypothetical protein